MNKVIRGRNIDTIFVLIVFSIFAFSVLMVLMLGASVYRNINDISREGQQEHTALSYVWTKTKNYDNAGSIKTGDFNGIPALFIYERIGDSDFRTAIYIYEGWLCELYSRADLNFSPGDGDRIMQINSLGFRDTGEGIIEVTVDNKKLFLSPRSSIG